MNNVKNTTLTLLLLSLLSIPSIKAMDFDEEFDEIDKQILEAKNKYKNTEDENQEKNIENVKKQGGIALTGLAKPDNKKEDNALLNTLKTNLWNSVTNLKKNALNFDYKPYMTKKNAVIGGTVIGIGGLFVGYKLIKNKSIKQAQLKQKEDELKKIQAKYNELLKPFESRGISATTVVSFFINTFTDEDYAKFGEEKNEEGLTLIELFTQDALECPANLGLITTKLPGYKLTLEQQYLISYLENLLLQTSGKEEKKQEITLKEEEIKSPNKKYFQDETPEEEIVLDEMNKERYENQN